MTESVEAVVARIADASGLEWGWAPLDPADFDPRAAAMEDWFERGFHGAMDWLRDKRESRIHPDRGWPWAKSFLIVKLPYDLPAPVRRGSAPQVAGYARSRDYHHRMDGILRGIRLGLEAEFPGIRTFQFCDDQHLPEVRLAEIAGLGWRGKHTLLLDRRGSAFHLGGILLSLEIARRPAPHPDHCGSCTACLDACPTGALLEPGLMDARLCLSHWTIEDRATPEGKVADAARGEVFGCDICQQACPWNRRAMTETDTPERWPSGWEQWVDVCRPGGGFQSIFTKTPLRRSGRHKLLKVLLRTLWNVDPVRADALARRALETETYPALVDWLRERTKAGNP